MLANFMPDMTRILGREATLADYLPVGAAPYYLQYHYIVTNPNPAGTAQVCSTMPATAATTASCTQSIIRSCAPPPRLWASSTS